MPPEAPAAATKLDRLRRAVAAHAAAHRATAPPAPPAQPEGLPPIERILRGEWRDTEHGPAFVRDDWFPLDHLHGAIPLGAPLAAAPAALGQLMGAGAPHPSRLAFFDIETTGLSTGTGSYLFLAGLGSFEDGAFRLRQYFLADVGGERAMLALLARDLARFEGLVTYNGRAFDVPFVQTRMTLARMPDPCGGLRHLDLLHAVRRLYRRRMPGCRLAETERRLLRIERYEDVPGALIPLLYFDYVRAGRASPLRAVFRHNADDVLSLAGVLAALCELFAREHPDPDDAVALARWWEWAGEPARALDLYRGAVPWLEGGGEWAHAASRQAMLCKRAGVRDEAVGLWRRLWQDGDDAAGVELAKHYEHHARDLPAAEEVTRALLLRCREDERMLLERRLTRLLRKQHH